MTTVKASSRCATAALPVVDPLAFLLLWGLALTGKVDQSLLELLGLQGVDQEILESVYGDTLAELRARKLSAPLFSINELAGLLRGQIGTRLAALDPGDSAKLASLARAAARLPLWVLEPELHQLEQEARREAATARLLEAHARREAAQLQREETALRREEIRARRARSAELADVSCASPGRANTGSLEILSEPSSTVTEPQTAVLVTDSASQVKPAEVSSAPSSEATELQNPVLVTNSAPQVKPAASRQPVQGKRKNSRVARKAANAVARR
ncbi:hypothetical protein IT575_15455 [bacterium]|nr:hypothetical protein [bacterium]